MPWDTFSLAWNSLTDELTQCVPQVKVEDEGKVVETKGQVLTAPVVGSGREEHRLD